MPIKQSGYAEKQLEKTEGGKTDDSACMYIASPLCALWPLGQRKTRDFPLSIKSSVGDMMGMWHSAYQSQKVE